ncbi:hypothetical protein GCM10022198_05950 [Klugiella xanthotipulae]|uniref:CT398-like coiled coil hairpin domain-containing protein n=1 Tax=Klugiella xanthotipulae TaxID=244735 RepID=A0A543HS32_9MICO|nr:hypothetical protein [Klugiella xanthotipulae]TQM61150.1 hypothetical protein FB466_2085 [Klugiella xanthotipulae]
MKASPEQQRRLLDVQAIDTRMGRAAHKGRTLPERQQLAALADGYAAAREALHRTRSVVELSQAEITRLEDDVATVRARADRDSARLSTSTSAKEAVTLESELATLMRRAAELEEVTLVVMERLEVEDAAFRAAENLYNDLAAQRAELEHKIAAEMAVIAEQRAAAQVERDEVVRDIDSDLLALYEETRQRYGLGAAMLRNGVSEGSNMALTEADLSGIRQARPDEILFCKDSGCILVRTDESGL